MALPLLAALAASRMPALILGGGLIVLFVLMAVLLWTRWGQSRPISNCVILSLLAHVLLVFYACTTQFLYVPPGRWSGPAVRVRLHDAEADEKTALAAAATAEPWSQDGPIDADLADASAMPDEAAAVAERASTPADEAPDETPAAAPAREPESVESPPAVAAQDTAPPAEAPTKSAEPPPVAPDGEMPKLADLLPDDASPMPNPEMPPATDAVVTEQAPESPPADLVLTSEPPAAAAEAPAGPASPADAAAARSAPVTPRRLGDGRPVPQALQARLAADRLQAAIPFGATPQTEAAVAAALDWLAAAQSADGRWDADAFGAGRETRTLGHDRQGAGAQADTGITGLALLAFLGSGETHLTGPHRESVQHGLEFLLASQAANGSLAGQAELFAAMYSHGIATLALSEAYALSGDQRLLPGLERALAYTLNSQHVGGGWRYQPHDAGDMSQFGWQVMALRSAALGGSIVVPATTHNRMVRFLGSCSSGRHQGLAAYRPGDRPSRTMTAEALACRYFLEAENAPGTVEEAARYVLEEPPGAGATNYYYWYYGTVALFQRQGEAWSRWNAALKRELLARQRFEPAVAGSWDPDDLWGGYGGRVYSTALAALSLEVYYRYLPLTAPVEADSRLTDRTWPEARPR